MARENQPQQPWTYHMEVSPVGAAPSFAPPQLNDPIALLHLMVNLQSQTLELLRQTAEMQRQMLELNKENTQFARDQRQRQSAELEKWQKAHEPNLEACLETLGRLEQVHSEVMRTIAEHVEENQEDLVDNEFSLSEFVDRYGPKLGHLNTVLAVLRPLAAAASAKKAEEAAAAEQKSG